MVHLDNTNESYGMIAQALHWLVAAFVLVQVGLGAGKISIFSTSVTHIAADGRALAHALRVVGKVAPIFVEDINDMAESIMSMVKDGDVVVTMGAGSISAVPGKLAQLCAGN